VNDLLEPPPEDDTGRPGQAVEHRPDHPPASVSVRSAAVVAAYTAFYRAQTSGLVRFLVWMGARLPDAADIAQEAMIEAYRRWETIEQPKAWIRRIASRLYLRRLAVVEEPVEQMDGRPLLPASHDLTEWEQHAEIRRLLALLPPRQRQVLAWTYDGYQPHEIADELGITPEAVRSSLKLARRTLAEQLPRENGPR
jgi:RNA polymerase sigma factor, sigma-70 family